MQLTTISDVERFLQTTKNNLIELERNLIELSYRFADTDGPVQLADAFEQSLVDDLEMREGRLPALYRHWYTMFRSVDFTQAPEQRESPNAESVAGLGLNCPLVFLDLNSCLRLREQLSRSGVRVRDPDGNVLIPTGGSASNCMPKGVWVPDSAIDPVLYDEGAGPVTMATEVHSAFAAGGFPFWDRLFRRRRFSSPLKNTPTFRELKPILTRNLILD